MNGTRYLLVLLVAVAVFLAGSSAVAQSDGIVIHHSWKGDPKVLNLSITGAPANVPIEVVVTQMPEWTQEQPNGSPPEETDGGGNWPGEGSGGEVGYPGTGNDSPGTEYVVSVIVDGKTGPSKGITKPFTFWSRLLNIFSLGLFIR